MRHNDFQLLENSKNDEKHLLLRFHQVKEEFWRVLFMKTEQKWKLKPFNILQVSSIIKVQHHPQTDCGLQS